MTTGAPESLAWGARVGPAFRDRLLTVCRELGWPTAGGAYHPSMLMACMAFESAKTFSPSIRNGAGSGAVGLIQFMPSTAIGLGTTVVELSRMSNVEQLEYVKKYFWPYRKRIKTLSDMYMAILLPKYIGADELQVLFASPSIAYRQNAGIDMNRDGIITKEEATEKVRAMYREGMSDKNRYDYLL